ncbi:MAG: hypothetical protein KJT03_03145 [Verrucomicrobiae bacterium]|nr:hypothetical protein [Verrucomicrobiae bacterium]
MEDAVEIVTGGIPDFYVDIISPDVMGYHQLATIFVEFGNRGSAPMQAPLLLVTALQNKNPGALMTLDQSLVTQGFWTSAIPKGFSTSVRLLASGKQPGLLLPGEHIRVPVYYAGWLKPWNFSYPPFEFTVVALTAQDSHPVPWALLETPMKLPSVDEDAWSAIWQNFTTAVGPTLGDLITTLSRNAVYLSRIGSEVRDMESLLAFELIKAEGLIGPLSELTGTVDLDVHRSQLTLQFARTFPRSIKQRYRKGPLGYGWNHTWEVRLAEQSDGTVILTRGNGATRVFQPDSRGGAYFSAQGSGSYLTRSGGDYVLNLENGTELVFDSSGRLDRMMDRYGSEILLHYSGDQLDRLSHSNGLEILLTYNGEGLIRLTEDSIGNQVEFEYDSGSHLVSAHHSQRGVTQYTYADSADLQKRHALTGISEEGNVDQTFGYDVSGRLATIGNALGNIHFTYQQGDVTSTDDLGHATQASFNHHGLLARIQDAESGVTTIFRDEESRTTSIRNADGTTMQTVRDRKGHMVKRINQDGQVWSYQTGNFGNIAKVVTPEGRIRSMDYDSQGNLTSLTEPDGSKIRFEYDALGRVTKRAMPSGIVETTTYNPVGLATLKAYSNGTSRQFEYDENNRLVKATNEEGDTSFTYDAAGNLTEVSYPNDLFISYDYDAAGRVTAVTDQNGRTSHYAYNAAGLLDEVTNSDETVSVSYMYDAAGRLAQKAFSSGARTVYERNGRGQITGQTTYDSSNTVLAGFSAEYNSVGLLSSYQTIQGNYDYRYDAVGRLVKMVHTPDSGPEEIQLFEHSPDGQLTSVSVDGVETAFTIDAGGRIAAIDGAPVTYDANGNVVSKGAGADNIDYQYDATGRVTEFTANTGSYQISYDALGTPLGIDAPSMSLKYLFDGLGKGMLYGEYDAAGDPVRTYHNGLGLAVVDYKGESYFPEFDPIKGETILSLSTTPLSSKMLQVARAGFSLQSFFPYLPPFAYDDFQVPMPGVYGWGLQGDAIEFASPYIQQAAQAVGFGVKDSSLDRILSRMTDGDTPEGGLMADVGFVAGLTGLFGGFNTVADGLARAANTVVVITDIPKPVLEGIEFLTGDNLGNVLGGFSLAFSGFEIASGVHETWSNGESVDLWEVANFATGSTEGGTQKIRHGMATGALTLLGMAAVGTAAAPVAAAAGIVAFISDNTIGLQEELYIWLTGLDVTGETLRGSRMSGSRDPNQKLGVSGYGPENYVAVDRRLTYRVDFENDSSASAPAQVVTIRDQLPDEVDWSTFEIVEVGFGDISIPVDPGTRFIEEVLDYAYQDNEYDFEVEVHIEVSIEDGEIFAIFYTLEPETGLPPPVDIGFLPPEVEKDPGNYQDGEGRGQGHLTYAVYPKTDLPTDTEIRNIATIQFDFSFNINTNQVDPLDASKGTDPDKEALVTIDSDIPQATVQALPALSLSEFQVNWNGQAASGIRNFDVYVRADGGAWNLWFSGTDQTQARFYGSRDANYEFYAVGTSNVGTSDPYSPAAQATTIAGIDDLFVTGYRAENGKMSISWIGSSGYQYQVQASGDLAAWENVGTVQTPTEAVEILSVVDDAYDFSSDRFYRVVILAESP